MKRGSILAAVAVIAVASSGIGWVAGQRVKSPGEIAAETAPPEPSLITVPVEQRALSSSVVLRGQAEFDDATDIAAPTSTSGASIVTRLTKQSGDKLEEGNVVVEVAGRPLIVLQGKLPIFRSLTPTLEGPDVLQLEEALVRLGFDPGPVDKIYDAATEEAVAALYRKAGYAPDEPTTEDLAQVESARQRVEGAKTSLRAAQQAVDSTGTTESSKLQQDQALRAAQNGFNDARSEAKQAKADASARIARAQANRDAAVVARDSANKRLQQAQVGVHPDTGAVPTAAEIDVLSQEAKLAEDAEARAQAAADDAADDEKAQAQADHDATVAALESANKRLLQASVGIHPDTKTAPSREELDALKEEAVNAAAALPNAQAELKEAVAAQPIVIRDRDRAVADALTEVAIQEASRKEALAQNGSDDATTQLSDAEKSLAEAEAELVKADAEVGVKFPAAELLFLPSLPRDIQRVDAAVGTTPTGAVMRVTGSGVVIRSAVSGTDRPLLVEGSQAVMENDDLGISVAATVAFVADSPGGPNASKDRYAVRLEPVEPLPENGFDQNYRITIPIESTNGDVLVVPLAALSAGADGTARVEVEQTRGQSIIVKVKTGLSSQGFVEITSLGEPIGKGDRVVVGRNIGPLDTGSDSASTELQSNNPTPDSDEDPDPAPGDAPSEPDNEPAQVEEPLTDSDVSE
jgi:hypothetical protein